MNCPRPYASGTPVAAEAARLEIVDTESGLIALQAEWRALLVQGSPNGLMVGPDWLLPWWQVFGNSDGRRLCVCAVREGERLIGVAPLLWREHRVRGFVPVRRLEPLGTGESEEDEVLSEYLGVVAERDSEGEVAAALVSAVTAGRFGIIDEVLIPFAEAGSPSLVALTTAFRERHWRVTLTKTTNAPYIALPPSWEEYLATLPSRRRCELRRAERHLEAWAGEEPRLHAAVDADGLAEGRAILERLHADRWAQADQPGVFASSHFRRFHDLLMPPLFERGGLDLLWLTARGGPVAALYNFTWDGRVYGYQCGRRMDLPPHLRPGFAIQAHAIRRAIARGCREYDFLGGSVHYKSEFALHARTLVEFRAERPGAKAKVRRVIERLAALGCRVRGVRRAGVLARR